MKYIEIDRLKSFIAKIQEKKQRIETNYFNTLNIFNDVLKNTTSEQTIAEITNRKQKLDTATNAAINTLDDVERKLKNALIEIEQDIENGIWNTFEKAREIANDIDRAASINPTDVYSNRLEYVKELRDTVEYGRISDSWSDSEVYEFESTNMEFQNSQGEFSKTTYESPTDVKAGLLNDEQYAFEDKLNNLERKLDREIEKLRVQGQTLESHKDAILSAIHNLEINSLRNPDGFGNQINKFTPAGDPELYFASLDKSVNAAVQKIDAMSDKIATAISILSSEQVINLEKISLPLIKSLESTLGNLTKDVTLLKKENNDYRRQLDDCKRVIDSLTQNNREKDMELDSSYKSWLESTRKLNDLEEVLLEQSREIQVLDDDKNQIINDLEKKILDTSDFLTQTIYEKEMLMRENEELVLTIQRIKKEHEEEKTSQIDEYVNTVSIQELVEKEANKIVDNKMSALLNRYQNEVEKIKSNSLNYLLSKESINDDGNKFVFDDLIDENEKSQLAVLQEHIKKFEKQISNLESKIKQDNEIKEKTEDALNDLNSLIGNDPYNMIDQEKMYLNKKFGQLEQKIEESLQRVTELEEQKAYDAKKELSNDELNELFISSPLYGAIKSELDGMEEQVSILKNENTKIVEENYAMNNIIDDTLRKLTINSHKMKEIEELLTKQEYEYMILNDEKNNVIDTLYSTLKDRDLSNMDELPDLKSLDKYDFSDFAKRSLDQDNKLESIDIMQYVKEEVEKIVSEELKFMKYKYDKELSDINEKYNASLEEHELKQVTEKDELDEMLNEFKEDYEGSNLLGENEIISDLKQKQEQLDKKIESSEVVVQVMSNKNAKAWNNDNVDGLDVSLSTSFNEWDANSKPILNNHYVTNKELENLNAKNVELEQKIQELQNMINQKSYEQIHIYEKQQITSKPVEINIDNSINNEEMLNDLKASQEQQLREIEQRLESSLGLIKNDQIKQLDKLNKKIDNIKVDNTEVLSGSVFDKYFNESNNPNRYLEKEIMESTDKLLKLQSLLLNLENEIVREEKKVITDL